MTFYAKFWRPFYSKISSAGTGLIEVCNKRKCVVICSLNEVHIGEVSYVCKCIEFVRDCKD